MGLEMRAICRALGRDETVCTGMKAKEDTPAAGWAAARFVTPPPPANTHT